MRFIILISSSLLLIQGWALKAQSIDSNTVATGTQIQKTLNEGKNLFKKGSSDDEAESSVQKISTTPPNSAQWHMECAMNLLRVAFACKEENDDKTAQRLAARVLIHLERAETLFAGDGDSLSSVHEIRGVVREQLLGDSNQALQSYREAIRQNPKNESARHRVQLLQTSSAGTR